MCNGVSLKYIYADLLPFINNNVFCPLVTHAMETYLIRLDVLPTSFVATGKSNIILYNQYVFFHVLFSYSMFFLL